MSSVWQIEFSDTARKQMAKLDRSVAAEILRYLRERIATSQDPRRFGEPLCKDLAGFWRYRVGAYRLICDIQDNKMVVLVLRLGHRSKVYGGH